MFHKALFVASCLLLARVAANPCVGFDTNNALYVFGLGHDVNLGPSSGWNANPLNGTTLTRAGRPPFNGTKTSCHFSQFQNALYVLNADSTQPSNIHIFNFDSRSWTTQPITAAGTDPNTLDAILDRDTNVFFALSHNQLYSLDMGSLTQADGSPRVWNYVQDPPFAQNNTYPHPVMALAQNHIHFLNIGTPAQANIFVIHFSFSQPTPQTFAPIENGGQGFPSTTGQTASIFKDLLNVQTKFAFIPDDGSATYIFDVIANTTQAMKGPKDHATLRLAAGQREIVQITTSGDVYWIPFNPDDAAPNYAANWTKLELSLGRPAALPGSGNTTSRAIGATETGTPTPNTGLLTRGKPGLVTTTLITLGLGICGLWSIL